MMWLSREPEKPETSTPAPPLVVLGALLMSLLAIIGMAAMLGVFVRVFRWTAGV